MTKNETIKLLAVINAAYPQAYSRIPEQVKADMINLWQRIFLDDEYQIVGQAVKTYLMNDVKGFIPPIGAIKEEVRKILFPDELTEQEAVNIIMERIQWKSSKEAFGSLPETLKKVVGSHHQLNTWGYMELDTVQSVISSNIQRSLKTILAQERDKQRTGQVKPIVESEKLIEHQNEVKELQTENVTVYENWTSEKQKQINLDGAKKCMEALGR